VTATGNGNSIVLVANGNFINTRGAASAQPGRRTGLVYSTNPALDRAVDCLQLKQYNATFGVTPILWLRQWVPL